MRTLTTQMRLRRLVRLHAAAIDRLRDRPFHRAQREDAARQLLEAAKLVRRAWLAELAAAGTARPGAAIERQIVRRLVAVEAAIATLAQAGTDLDRARAEFEDEALPLLLMVRGLEGYAGASPAADPVPLARTA